ncbi:MAG: YncE family protein [Planctomycetota bacterium]|jgi:DNA-binding beta-propeller fold protein YncE
MKPGLYTLLVLFILALSASEAQGQRVFTYDLNRPSLTCTNAVYGSEVTLCLRGAPPGAVIVWTFGFCKQTENLGEEELDPASLEVTNESPPTVETADFQGHAKHIISLKNRDWVGRTVLVKALVRDPEVPENTFFLYRVFTVDNPELYLPSFVPGQGGVISKFDEVAGDLIARIQHFYGAPRKVVFSRDGKKGFVMLEGDRIAVFDNLSNQCEYLLPSGIGLADILVTPDGRKLIAVTRGVGASPLTGGQGGNLWIYSTDDLLAPPESFDIYPVAAANEGNILVASSDSTLVLIRQAGLYVGKFNLLSREYQPFELGEARHFRGEVRDIQIYGNGLLALIAMPDLTTDLYSVSLQTFQNFYKDAGRDARRLRLIERQNRLPLVAMIDRGGEEEDRLLLIDVFGDIEHAAIPLPKGVTDFDASETVDLCMLLYQDPPTGEGVLRFIDLTSLALLPRTLSIDLDSNAQVYLSRAENLHTGYIYSEGGVLTPIDLDTFRVLERIQLDGFCSGCPVEIY